MKNYINNRRQFVKNLGLTSLGLTTMPASILKMKTWAAAAATNTNLDGSYKALVCFYMAGGNDGFNMLVPNGDEYQVYENSRSTLALDKEELISIDAIDNQGPQLGLHPQLTGVKDLFNEGALSFMCNIGTMLVPETTKMHYENQTNIPISLFSHSDQAQQWHTARVDRRGGSGWAGRVADMIGDTNTNQKISMNISIDNGTGYFLRGEQTNGYSISSRSVATMPNHHPEAIPGSYTGIRSAAIDSMFNHDYNDPFYNSYNSIVKNGIESNIEFKAALDDFEVNGGIQSSFSTSEAGYAFSASLKRVAQSIAIAPGLGFERQIYFVNVGGFDNHKDLIEDHSVLMHQVDTGLKEFYAALKELEVEDKVVTFSTSDFGRTLTSNGSGSDHAWGSNAIVMGGPVIGQTLFGEYPDLTLGNSIDLGKGTLIPSMSSDLYFAELAHWFGVPKEHLGDIFPNLKNFVTISDEDLPLGFLDI